MYFEFSVYLLMLVMCPACSLYQNNSEESNLGHMCVSRAIKM